MSEHKQVLILRGSKGIGGVYGKLDDDVPAFPHVQNPACRDINFTPDGSRFSWCTNLSTSVADGKTYEVILKIPDPQVSALQLSPKGTYLSTWSLYASKASQQESANLQIYDVESGELKKAFIQKKHKGWNPQWSDDEHLCARNVSNEVHFFEDAQFGIIAKKIHMQKVAYFTLAPGPPPYHVVCFVPGVKGQPSFIRLFKYPNFDGANSVIAQKSFFKAERVDFYWNKIGTNCVVVTSVDVDKSGSSYYGELNLYHISVGGDASKLKLAKDGPAYSIEWSPNSKEFCVVYGYMPAKATIYNLKCEPVMEFDPAPRNEVKYSPVGDRLALFGFGNLQGRIQVWDRGAKKQISQFTAVDSTCLRWSPDGELILTATTAPRLRIANGYRVWHYTGSLQVEEFLAPNDELYDILWQPAPEGTFRPRPTPSAPVPGIQSRVPLGSKEAYRPPAAQGKAASFKLHDFEEPKKEAPVSLTSNQKKHLARKAKSASEKQENSAEVGPTQTNNVDLLLTGDPEKDKKIRSLQKKIDQIEKLKRDHAAGKKLELNQLEKIKKLDDMQAELENLQIGC